jgi:hypothetical protein
VSATDLPDDHGRAARAEQELPELHMVAALPASSTAVAGVRSCGTKSRKKNQLLQSLK